MTPRHEFPTEEAYFEYLRHYYAGQAMNGLIANAPNGHLSNFKQGVPIAIDWTDALIKELKEKK